MTKYIISILCIFMITSCSLVQDKSTNQMQNTLDINHTTNQADDGCLQPLTKFAFPSGDSGISAPEQKPVLPNSDWKLVASVQNTGYSSNPDMITLELIRKSGDSEEYWFIDRSTAKLLQYFSDTQKWVSGSKDVSIISRISLFIDLDNNVWGRKIYEGIGNSLLYQFNNARNVFEPISDKDSILIDNNKSFIPSLVVDHTGIFWILLSNNERANTKEAYQLIRFDPINREAKIYLSGANFTNSMAIDNNDNIYILDLDQSQIIKFSPKTQETTKYKVPIVLDAPPSVYLFYDRDDRLWLGDRGWFDFSSGSNPQWFNVIRSPVFINYLQSGGIWGWGRPFFTYQDENGILWFTSIRGTGWLNSEEGQWCIFTTYSSRVFEDDQQNLWLFVHGGLYTKIK